MIKSNLNLNFKILKGGKLKIVKFLILVFAVAFIGIVQAQASASNEKGYHGIVYATITAAIPTAANTEAVAAQPERQKSVFGATDKVIMVKSNKANKAIKRKYRHDQYDLIA